MANGVSIIIPDFAARKGSRQRQPSPLDVLRDAANLLGQQTGEVVLGDVFVAPFTGTIRYTFSLLVPSVNDFIDPLFFVWTDEPSHGYPVHLVEGSAHGSQANLGKICGNASDLAAAITELFAKSWVTERIDQWIDIASGPGSQREPAG
jgi:hypothetical protein